jgi:hypothetical protein
MASDGRGKDHHRANGQQGPEGCTGPRASKPVRCPHGWRSNSMYLAPRRRTGSPGTRRASELRWPTPDDWSKTVLSRVYRLICICRPRTWRSNARSTMLSPGRNVAERASPSCSGASSTSEERSRRYGAPGVPEARERTCGNWRDFDVRPGVGRGEGSRYADSHRDPPRHPAGEGTAQGAPRRGARHHRGQPVRASTPGSPRGSQPEGHSRNRPRPPSETDHRPPDYFGLCAGFRLVRGQSSPERGVPGSRLGNPRCGGLR